MKIYTKTGDLGQTKIVGGKILPKNDIRIKAYGGIDELNSWLGYTRSLTNKTTNELNKELEEVQQLLFDCGKDLATLDRGEQNKFIFNPDSISWLEQSIDSKSQQLPAISKFILPAGSQLAAALQVARTITRRIERDIVELKQKEKINSKVLIFINRLSDYFFINARYANYLLESKETFYRNSKNVFK